MSRVFLFSTIILVIIAMITLFPKHLCIPKKWQCKQYKSTRTVIESVAIAIKHFQSRNGYLPRDITTLTKPQKGTQVKYLEKIELDQWANSFIYIVKKKDKFLLYSVGVNGKDESGWGDDITFENEHSKAMYCN